MQKKYKNISTGLYLIFSIKFEYELLRDSKIFDEIDPFKKTFAGFPYMVDEYQEEDIVLTVKIDNINCNIRKGGLNMKKQDFIQALEDGKTVLDTENIRSVKLDNGMSVVTTQKSASEIIDCFDLDVLVIVETR